jgi:hypothetical protein
MSPGSATHVNSLSPPDVLAGSCAPLSFSKPYANKQAIDLIVFLQK